MPTNADQLHGTLDMLVLKVLAAGAQHGYGIAVRLHQLSADVLRVEEGSLYPALYRMEQRGWIRSSWGLSDNNRRARFYQLTRAGRRQLGAETEPTRTSRASVGLPWSSRSIRIAYPTTCTGWRSRAATSEHQHATKRSQAAPARGQP